MAKQKKRKPTMKDVARLAGVSQTTVSFVINNNTNVSIPEETKERVWAAVLELGYRLRFRPGCDAAAPKVFAGVFRYKHPADTEERTGATKPRAVSP